MRLLIYTPTYTRDDGSLAMAPECGASIREQRIDGHPPAKNPIAPAQQRRNPRPRRRQRRET